MSSAHSSPLPYESAETETRYSLEVIAELTGVDTATILHYREAGFIPPAERSPASQAIFDQEDLRQVRRIEHLRANCAVNDQGLRLILNLLDEVESLRQQVRQRW